MSKQGLDDLNAFCCDADKHNNRESGGGSGASEETINREPAQAPATTDDAMRNTREDIRQHYGLADNCYGNRVIDNIMKRSKNSMMTAKSVLPQYIEKIGVAYPKQFDELIITKFMDDTEIRSGHKLPVNKQQQRSKVPQIIAYMEHTTYRPTLD